MLQQHNPQSAVHWMKQELDMTAKRVMALGTEGSVMMFPWRNASEGEKMATYTGNYF